MTSDFSQGREALVFIIVVPFASLDRGLPASAEVGFIDGVRVRVAQIALLYDAKMIERTNANRRRMPPPAVWLGLTLVVLLDTPMQLIWKDLMAHEAASAGTLLSRADVLITQPLFWALLLLFGLQFFNWMWVLGEADLSFAQPFTALSYLTISSGAVWIFREHLSIGRVSGITLILGGVLLVGSTPHKTVASEGSFTP